MLAVAALPQKKPDIKLKPSLCVIDHCGWGYGVGIERHCVGYKNLLKDQQQRHMDKD